MSPSNSINIELDQKTHTAGDVISGKITIHIIKPFECKKIYVQFFGWEYTSRQKEKGRIYESCVVLDFKYMLSAKEETLEPGSYEFPFSYQLEDDLPGSMNAFEKKRTILGSNPPWRATVNYELRAIAKVSKFFARSIKAHKEVQIFQKPPAIMKPLSDEIQTNVSRLLVVDKGGLIVRAHTARDVYAAGEKATLYFSVENKSSQDFKAVTVGLYGRAYYRCRGYGGNGKRSIAEKEFPPSKQGESFDGEHTFDIQTLVDLNGNLQPSMEGNLTDLEYVFRIKLHATWAKDIRLELPVTLISKELLGRVKMQPK